MAKMEQSKLTQLCNSINNASDSYVRNVGSAVRELADTFNNNWCSSAAKKLGEEISEKLSEVATSVTNVFNGLNDALKTNVENFKTTEEEYNINYPGFSFGTPNTKLELHEKLPDGYVGVAEGADLQTINGAMKKITVQINSSLEQVYSAAQNSQALDTSEMNALRQSINKIKNSFSEGMRELEASLNTRMSGEIASRDELDRVNVENLTQ